MRKLNFIPHLSRRWFSLLTPASSWHSSLLTFISTFGWSLCSLRSNFFLFWPLYLGFTRNSSLQSSSFLSLEISFTLRVSNGIWPNGCNFRHYFFPQHCRPSPFYSCGPAGHASIPNSTSSLGLDISQSMPKWTFPLDSSVSVNGINGLPARSGLKSCSDFDSFSSFIPYNHAVTSLPEIFATFFPIAETHIYIAL